ncbi:uncharacterized protein BKA55DRAFT_223318 [Fusarium redolens]|uniref:DUF7730 domain-containing protein n=1 Tax=Fusarium redolens TaxID=48865 RepID=A0A9P9HX02_FUSRE|nr:uncharacterized protein BKA55DRAFT_223318 [Fusarium redolens]KAH7264801.1 hypothetical protein BKA55DRAFT_223318 [Fusarium redolens]
MKSTRTKKAPKMKQRCGLLDLPVEIRLKIYDLLLVSRFNRCDHPYWAVGDSYQKLIMLDVLQNRRHRTMEPAILQTCKQIYHEAVPILYSRNVFRISGASCMSQLMDQIGQTNTRMIQHIDIYIPPNCNKSSWMHLFQVLPETTLCLKSVVVRWWGIYNNLWEESLGKDIPFAQALARLSKLGIEKLRLEGSYAKPWPAYFRDKFGAQMVDVEDGCPRPLRGDNDDDDTRKWRADTLEKFRKYQEGTESLNPWEGDRH